MFCTKCGSENQDGAKFCKSCGNPLNATKTEAIVETVQTVETETVASNANSNQAAKAAGNAMAKAKSLPKAAIIGIIAAIVVIIGLIWFFVDQSNTINLNDYLKIEVTGSNGYGTAKASIDWEAMRAKYGDKVKLNANVQNQLGSMASMIDPMMAMRAGISVKLTDSTKLSNGSKVKYTWNVNEEMRQGISCKLKFSDGEHTVSGLSDVGSFDAFADLTVQFSGVAPNAKATLNYTGSEMKKSDFKCDKTTGLSNGDVITVTIDESRVEYYAKNKGMVPQETTKTFTVEGLSDYLQSAKNIDEATRNAMQEEARKVLENQIKSKSDVTLEGFEYVGNYFLTAKENRSPNNYLPVVYKVTISHPFYEGTSETRKTTEYLWCIQFENLMSDKDGKVTVDITRHSTPSTSVEIDQGKKGTSTRRFSVAGFKEINDIFERVVKSKESAYNIESNIAA